jgi:copper chaperone CopZ
MPVETTHRITGLTCGHCVEAVSSEVRSLPGVVDVAIDLVPGGESTLRLRMSDDAALDAAALAGALDEAGDYALAP